MLNRFGQLLAKAMFDVGIGSYSELLKCLWDAGADPEEASIPTLVNAIKATKVDACPDFSKDFWSVLVSPDVLDLTEDESKALMHAFVTSEAEIPSVVDHASVAQ
jgi:hypothetical protein